jgi:flagellar hook-associated protein 3 FlgL
MRIIFDVLRDGLSSINQASSALARAQQQVASGRRLSAISDDPRAAEAAIGERATLGAIDAYTRTRDSAAARLAAIDVALGGIGDKLTSAIVAGLSARGTNINPAARAAAAQSVRGLRDAILADINATFNGRALFAGTAVDQRAYALVAGAWTYQGNAATVQVEVEANRLVDVTLDGQGILQGSDSQNVLAVLDDLALAIEAGDNTAIGTGLDALQRAFDRTERAHGLMGADQHGLDEATARLAALRIAADARRASLEDANMAEAITRLSQAENAYRAALGAVSTAERQSLLDYLR